MPYDPATLKRLGERHRKLRTQLDDVRDQLREQIIAGAREDVDQRDLAELSGYQRNQIRIIERDAGLPPRRQGRRTG